MDPSSRLELDSVFNWYILVILFAGRSSCKKTRCCCVYLQGTGNCIDVRYFFNVLRRHWRCRRAGSWKGISEIISMTKDEGCKERRAQWSEGKETNDFDAIQGAIERRIARSRIKCILNRSHCSNQSNACSNLYRYALYTAYTYYTSLLLWSACIVQMRFIPSSCWLRLRFKNTLRMKVSSREVSTNRCDFAGFLLGQVPTDSSGPHGTADP